MFCYHHRGPTDIANWIFYETWLHLQTLGRRCTFEM